MTSTSKLPIHLSRPVIIAAAALLTVVLATLFALYTQHAWEDYYITFRSSQNLATGHGLVYNWGDRLHTFTSPIGVLLPALAYLLTGNSSAAGALWIFRAMSILALAGAVVVLLRLAGRRGALLAGGFLVACLLTESKTLDFTINGMETAFMLLFLAFTLHAHLVGGPRQFWRLGAAWGGLMWTRPDGCVYIALLALAFFLFHDPSSTGGSRRQLFKLYLRAALVCTVIYLPWFVWAWWYYGSPIPHTIIAKSGLSPTHTLGGLLHAAVTLPVKLWKDSTALEAFYLPSYFIMGGWPAAVREIGRGAALLASLLWVLPGLRKEARAASFACYGLAVYLTYFTYFPFPWYLPPPAFLGFVALALAAGQVWTSCQRVRLARWRRPLLMTLGGLGVLFIAGQAWVTVEAARELRAQENLIENHGRRVIGEWLHDHAQPRDTVFMEPLGYIGYFSGLKTYDWPGMSSREMVAARRIVGSDWHLLIRYLQPNWLVLRPTEINRINQVDMTLLSHDYQPVRTFDNRAAVAQADIYGKPYLAFDSVFTVYRREHPTLSFIGAYPVLSDFPTSPRWMDGVKLHFAHAPGLIIIPIPPGVTKAELHFAFGPGADLPPNQTDGATFVAEMHDPGQPKQSLYLRHVNPVGSQEERAVHQTTVSLPANRSNRAALWLITRPGGTTDKDWTFWSLPEFQ